MRVVHVSTHDLGGGAARASYRLHKGLQGLGHDSLMYVSVRSSGDPTVVEYAPPMAPAVRFRRFIRRRRIERDLWRYDGWKQPGAEVFSDDRSKYGAGPVAQLPGCDIVTLHWVAGFVDYQAFLEALPAHVPVVWILHDMNPMTGGCHFDGGCGRFRAGCGACPQLDSAAPGDLSQRIWRRKKAAFDRCAARRLHVVAISRWMADRVAESPLLSRFPMTVIPNGLDVTEFAPGDTCGARDALGVPQDAKVVLFVAESTANRRKGFDLLAEALGGLREADNLLLLSVGRHQPELNGRIPHRHLGSVEHYQLPLVYRAADLFVIPSLQDNLPNTVLESMACGTPVVGFAVGGIPDMVRQDATGLLARAADPDALRVAIDELLRDAPRRLDMGRRCRQVAVEEYSLERQARRYGELYQSLVP